MNKRRVLEANRRQKIPNKRPSEAALQAQSKSTDPSKSSEPPSLPITEKTIQCDNTELCEHPQGNPGGDQKSPGPKTKFSSSDKSVSFRSSLSPRLKSFPAEEIRRFNASPRVESISPFFPSTGHGDGSPDGEVASSQLPRRDAVSQPVISHQIANQFNQPEVFNFVPHQRSPDRQAHRPCVPRANCEQRLPTEHHSEGNVAKLKESEEIERQPIGGRNAAHFRQQMLTNNLNYQQMTPVAEELTTQKPQHKLPQHVQFADSSQHIPPDMYDYRHPQETGQSLSQQFSGLGMTSPQDMTINQQKMCQYGLHQHLHQHPTYPEQMNGQWLQRPCQHSPNYHLHQQPKSFHQQKRQLPQPDQFYQLQQQSQLQRSSEPQELAQQAVSSEQQQEYAQQGSRDEQEGKTSLQFTPEMLRDQNRLLETMSQQGFSSEIIKRQFDALLSEQRKQLTVLHHIKHTQYSEDDKQSVEYPRRRRRITKIEEDEKPDWMMHITPPWISYAALEMQSVKQKEQKPVEKRVIQPEHQQCDHQHQSATNAQHPAQLQWQQQVVNWSGYQQHYQPSPHQYYQVPQPTFVQNSSPHQQQQQQYQCQEQQQHSYQNEELIPPKLIEPSSLLQLKMYKKVIKQQKQNNGLQDPETIKKAMKALKNPTNRPGLEYLANLNKKEKQIKLNGIQEPNETVLNSYPHRPPNNFMRNLKQEPRANGLENARNPNNPTPLPTLHLRNTNPPMPVYPKRIDHENHYTMQSCQNPTSALQNTGDPTSTGYKNQFQAQVYAQDEGGSSDDCHQSLAGTLGRSLSSISDMHSQHREYYGNCQVPGSCFQGGCGDCGQQGQFGPTGSDHAIHEGQPTPGPFLEPRLIGGVKYFGRKPEFIPNSSSTVAM